VVRARGGFTSGIGLLSPLVAIFDAAETAGPEAMRYWTSLLLVQCLGWTLLARADVRLRNSLGEDYAQVLPVRRPAAPGLAAAAARRADGEGEGDPIEWLVCRQPGIRATLRGAVILAAVYDVFSWTLHQVLGFPLPGFLGLILQPIGLAGSLLAEGLWARGAGRFFSEARQSGQLEALLTTPRGARAMLSGQLRGLSRLLRWPVGLYALVALASEVSILARGPESLTAAAHFWSVDVPVTGLFILANAVGRVLTCCWLGMWFGILGHTPLATMTRGAGLTTGVPFLFRILVMFGLAGPIAIRFGHDLELLLVVGWCVTLVILLYYVLLIRHARRGLLAELSGNIAVRVAPKKRAA
jgi:hypothetical protein